MNKAELITVEHDFSGREVNGINGVNGKKCQDRAFHLVNKLHDFIGIHCLSGKFCYDNFFRKTHARLYKWMQLLNRRVKTSKNIFQTNHPNNVV